MTCHRLTSRPAFYRATHGHALRPFAVAIAVLLSLGLGSGVRGQGLLDIGAGPLEAINLPLSGSFNSSLGWDSDAGSRSSGQGGVGRGATSTGPSGESAVWQNTLNLSYGRAFSDGRNLSVNGNYGNVFYFDPPPGVDDMDHNFRMSASYSHQLSKSLSISDSIYISYETEPNYDVGLSINRPNSGYFLVSNNLSADYRWNRRFTSVTRYTFSTIVYDDEALEQEGYVNHQFSEQFRYSFKRRLTGTATYRYGMRTYEDNAEGDYSSHSLLAGINYGWNRRLSLTANAGLEYRLYDGEIDDQLAPRVEASASYTLAKRTRARWVHSLSLDETGRAGEQSGYSYRTGLSLSHGVSRRLNTNASINYIFADYGDSPSGLEDSTENTFYGSLGIGYNVWKNVSLTASYSYSLVSSNDGSEDYVRHRFFAGVSYAF
jgi:opacity protein-like surface antigen